MEKIEATEKSQVSHPAFDADYVKDLLSVLHEIGDDLAFLHRILFDFNGLEDETRKVEVTLPYLQRRIDVINDTLENYVPDLPEALREPLSPIEI